MKKLNIICLFLMIAMRVCAQTDSVVVSRSQLCGTKWERTFPTSKYSSVEIMFNDSVIVDNYYNRLLDKRVLNSFEYYITDKLPSYSIFYRKYVGQERTGCYIVEYNSKVKRVDYYIVVSLTEKELVLYHRATPGQIPNIDTYIRYRRIDENKNYPDTISLHAQNFHKENLVGKKWRFRAEDDRIYSVFSDSLWTTYIGHDNPDLSVKYYLSETADSIYLADRVGREKTGSYIVTCEQLHDEGEIKTQLVVYKIMALTPTLLLLRSGDKTYDFYNLPDEEVPTNAKFRPDIR